ncbi:3-hydroxyacyl-CoA dehydrogenase family protein [Actinophytocola sediminis]
MTRPFDTVWVIGLGAVGSAIALLLAEHGYRVVGIEANEESLAAARTRLRRRAGEAAARELAPSSYQDELLARVECTTEPGTARPADLVIEAVPERGALKAEVLARATQLNQNDTVFVTTSIGLAVHPLAARIGRLAHTVGVHLCDTGRAPASILVEVAPTPMTDRTVLDAVHEFVRSLGRHPVAVTDHPGLFGNSVLLRHLNRAVTTFTKGYASRDDIDAAMRLGCGFLIGPLAHTDLIGLDNVHDGLTAIAERTGDPAMAPAPLLGRMVDVGLLGRRSGRGFYRYGPDERPPSPDPSPDPAAGRARPVCRVGVVGSGRMATGIAELLTRFGHGTVVVARTDVAAKQVRSSVEESLAGHPNVSADELDSVLARLHLSTEFAALGECDLVIESVTDDLAVKQAVFARIDRATRPGTVLATTTTRPSVLACATATSRPWDVVGLRFLHPVASVPLVEVVHTFYTRKEIVATAEQLVATLGKYPVVVSDRAGFLVNALLFPFLNDVVRSAHAHRLNHTDTDRLLTDGYGLPTGPFQLLDRIGVDRVLALQQAIHDESGGDPSLAPATELRDLAAATPRGLG